MSAATKQDQKKTRLDFKIRVPPTLDVEAGNAASSARAGHISKQKFA